MEEGWKNSDLHRSTEEALEKIYGCRNNYINWAAVKELNIIQEKVGQD